MVGIKPSEKRLLGRPRQKLFVTVMRNVWIINVIYCNNNWNINLVSNKEHYGREF